MEVFALLKGNCALPDRADSVKKRITDILHNQFNRSEFYTKSQNTLFLLHESYTMMLITEKASNLIGNGLNQYRMYTFLSQKNKYPFLLLSFLLITMSGITQSNNDKKKIVPSGYNKTVSLGISIPFPEFSQTHKHWHRGWL